MWEKWEEVQYVLYLGQWTEKMWCPLVGFYAERGRAFHEKKSLEVKISFASKFKITYPFEIPKRHHIWNMEQICADEQHVMIHNINTQKL